MAMQTAAVGTVSPGDRSRSVRSASVTTMIAARSPVLRSSAPASSRRGPPARTHIPTRNSRKARTRASGPRTHARHLGAAKLLTPANEGDPMAATALTPHRVNHLIPPGTEEP